MNVRETMNRLGRKAQVAIATALIVVAGVAISKVAHAQSTTCTGGAVCSYGSCCKPMTVLPQTTNTPPKDYEAAEFGCATKWIFWGCWWPSGYCGGTAAIPSANCP